MITANPLAARALTLVLMACCGAATAAPRPADARAAALAPEVAVLASEVERWFGAPFPRDFALRVFASRTELDAYWQAAWKAPDFRSECWMVASGTGSGLVLLDPETWGKEACEHDRGDAHRREILRHELVHVFHGQRSPDPEFERQEAIGWFVEGLAVLVSGQLDAGRRDRARAALKAGRGPHQLEDGWKGADRYGISGLLVEAVEARVGRQGMLELLRHTDEAALLAAIRLSEPALLDSLAAAR